MIAGKNFFLFRTYDNNQKISTGQGDNYITGCLMDYSYFKEHYKMIARDLSKQQEIYSDPKAIQQINFTRNLKNEATPFSLLRRLKKQF